MDIENMISDSYCDVFEIYANFICSQVSLQKTFFFCIEGFCSNKAPYLTRCLAANRGMKQYIHKEVEEEYIKGEAYIALLDNNLG